MEKPEIKEILTNPQKRAAYNQALLQQETIDSDKIQQQVYNRIKISYKPSFAFIACILFISKCPFIISSNISLVIA